MYIRKCLKTRWKKEDERGKRNEESEDGEGEKQSGDSDTHIHPRNHSAGVQRSQPEMTFSGQHLDALQKLFVDKLSSPTHSYHEKIKELAAYQSHQREPEDSWKLQTSKLLLTWQNVLGTWGWHMAGKKHHLQMKMHIKRKANFSKVFLVTTIYLLKFNPHGSFSRLHSFY